MLVVVESKIVKNLRLEKNYFQCKYETNERKRRLHECGRYALAKTRFDKFVRDSRESLK